MAELRPPLDPLFRAFGVPATVTPPGGLGIATTVIVGARHGVFPGTGAPLTIAEFNRIVTLRRDQVPSAPADTVIVTAAGTFKVDGVAREDDQLVAVTVR